MTSKKEGIMCNEKESSFEKKLIEISDSIIDHDSSIISFVGGVLIVTPIAVIIAIKKLLSKIF